MHAAYSAWQAPIITHDMHALQLPELSHGPPPVALDEAADEALLDAVVAVATMLELLAPPPAELADDVDALLDAVVAVSLDELADAAAPPPAPPPEPTPVVVDVAALLVVAREELAAPPASDVSSVRSSIPISPAHAPSESTTKHSHARRITHEPPITTS